MPTSLDGAVLHVIGGIVFGLISTDQVGALGASRTLASIVVAAGLARGATASLAGADGRRAGAAFRRPARSI